MNYLKAAHQYRQNCGSEAPKKGGVVLFWEGVAYAWKNELRNPEHERPGVLAIDMEGHIFKAEGGDDQNGAKVWTVLGEN